MKVFKTNLNYAFFVPTNGDWDWSGKANGMIMAYINEKEKDKKDRIEEDLVYLAKHHLSFLSPVEGPQSEIYKFFENIEGYEVVDGVNEIESTIKDLFMYLGSENSNGSLAIIADYSETILALLKDMNSAERSSKARYADINLTGMKNDCKVADNRLAEYAASAYISIFKCYYESGLMTNDMIEAQKKSYMNFLIGYVISDSYILEDMKWNNSKED